MDRNSALAASSRDSHLALRRVERHQTLIERLNAAHGRRIRIAELAADLTVSERTLARDVQRLRDSGVPITAHQGRGGGVRLPPVRATFSIDFDLPEAVALLSSLTALGPTATQSATSAMRKIVDAMTARCFADSPGGPADRGGA